MNFFESPREDRPDVGEPFSKQAAKFCLYAPVVVILISFFASSGIKENRALAIAIGCVVLLLIAAGVVLGVSALAGIKSHGTRGILVPAVIGLLINGVLLTAFWTGLQTARGVSTQLNAAYSEAELRSMPARLRGGVVVIDAAHGLRFEVPAGFSPVPGEVDGKQVLAHYRMDLASGGAIVIAVNSLGGTIGEERFGAHMAEGLKANLPPGSTVAVTREVWAGSVVIDGAKIGLVDAEGGNITAWSAQIPKTREAIQLNVAGPKQLEAQTRGVLRQVLGSFQARSNWPSVPVKP